MCTMNATSESCEPITSSSYNDVNLLVKNDQNYEWLDKYVQSENMFLEYLKSVTMPDDSEQPTETEPPEDFTVEDSGWEALDNLYDLVISLCEQTCDTADLDPNPETIIIGSSGANNKSTTNKTKRTFKKYLSSNYYGKDLLQVKHNRARSHSSVGVDEILRSQTVSDIGTETRRKSRRVSLGMRPRFSNWSKVKDAFKRDKSGSRISSKEIDAFLDVTNYNSGDEAQIEKIDPQSSSSHGNTTQMSSSDEEFEFYDEAFPKDNDENKYVQLTNGDGFSSEMQKANSSEYIAYTPPLNKYHMRLIGERNVVSENNSPVMRKPFKLSRKLRNNSTASANNLSQDLLQSAPSSPLKNRSRFLFDEETVTKMIDDNGEAEYINKMNLEDTNEALREVQERYRYLQNQLSSEFSEKYHEWNNAKRSSLNSNSNIVDEDELLDFGPNDSKPPFLCSSHHNRNFSPSFRRKFQEWQRMKGLSPTRMKSNINKTDLLNLNKKQKSDRHKWRPGSKSESNVLRYLEDQDSEDIPHEIIADDYPLVNNDEDSHAGRIVKQGVDLIRGKYHNDKKELAWLEKELQKVAREKQRLEKEKEKYSERENRLQNMKKAIKSGRKQNKQEILVPTSNGLFRFQGISSKFARKLYEWEKARGITAESSTFALLDPHYISAPQRVAKLQTSDMILSMQRSRSVGSVDIAGVGISAIEHDVTVSHQQSSLSLNDMEHLEESHLRTGEENLNDSECGLYEQKCDDKDVTIEEIPNLKSDFNDIPSLTDDTRGSMDCFQNISSDHTDYRKHSSEYDSDTDKLFQKITKGSSYQLRRESANADAESIVKQIQTLRAGTSMEDEDRMNTLSNMQHLADQLLFMVSEMDSKKTENVDELASQFAALAIKLKQEIKKLTMDGLQQTSIDNVTEVYDSIRDRNLIIPKLAEDKTSKHNTNIRNEFSSVDGGVFSDVEDNDSPTLHCTFTLPTTTWRRTKGTTPSSTDESESSNMKKTKNSSTNYSYDEIAGDENYDGEDETTVYFDLRHTKPKFKNRYQRESSADVSTSNSDNTERNNFSDVANNDDRTILENENDADVIVTSYESPKLIGKRQCSVCGKIKKLVKGKKNSFNYCICGRSNKDIFVLESEDSENLIKDVDNEKNNRISSNVEDTAKRKMGKISRCKVIDFNSEEIGEETKNLTPDLRNSEMNLKNNSNKKLEFLATNSDSNSDRTINVIVPTTRTIFAPLKDDEKGGLCKVVSYTVDDEPKIKEKSSKNLSLLMPPCWLSKDGRSKSVSPSFGRKDVNDEISNSNNQCLESDKEKMFSSNGNSTKSDEILFKKERKISLNNSENVNERLPPASPLILKRSANNKECNSSIRLMVAHYNKMMFEKPDRRTSEGNCWSPTIQKSPVLERRTHFEHLKNESDKTNVRKSKSAVLNKTENQNSSILKIENSSDGLLKSSSTSVIDLGHISPSINNFFPFPPVNSTAVGRSDLRTTDDEFLSNYKNSKELNSSFENLLSETRKRSIKLKEARQKFFNINSENTNEDPPQVEHSKNLQLKSAEVEEKKPKNNNNLNLDISRNDFNNSIILSKSISTGSINSRLEISPSVNNIPIADKSTSSTSKGKFGFSSITSKFRKAKMRRNNNNKDHEMSTVSSLCKASLSLHLDNKTKCKTDVGYFGGPSKSCPSSPIITRKIFAKRNSSSN